MREEKVVCNDGGSELCRCERFRENYSFYSLSPFLCPPFTLAVAIIWKSTKTAIPFPDRHRVHQRIERGKRGSFISTLIDIYGAESRQSRRRRRRGKEFKDKTIFRLQILFQVSDITSGGRYRSFPFRYFLGRPS